MRTIKFRGKGVNSGQWFYGSAVNYGSRVFLFNMFRLLRMEHVEVIPETVGQFTGLTDKHGTDIYEGDIIRSSRNGFGGVVMWHKDGYFYICDDMERKDLNDYNKLGVMLKKHPHFVVEGNVVDNPLHNPKLN